MTDSPFKPTSKPAALLAMLGIGMLHTATITQAAPALPTGLTSEAFAVSCTPASAQAAADRASVPITIGEIANLTSSAALPGGAKYFPATDALPAYCQVAGTFVTNPETGKTANFVATFPDTWNGKYLQYGCFSTCGFIALNDATSPLVTIIAQGMPGDSLRKGYASFGTDEGHDSRDPASWALRENGKVDVDALDDYLQRATAVLATVGKEFTAAYYSQIADAPQTIRRAYFNGCSGGGRDGLVAASYFPEAFDGIIAGSPAGDMARLSLQAAGLILAASRSADAAVSAELASRVGSLARQQCDGLDGVVDSLIQNPAACDFLPERDLPECGREPTDGQCFTKAQIETVSTYLTAVRDERGNIVQPGFSISDFQAAGVKNMAPEILRVMAFGNPAGFSLDDVVRLTEGDDGQGFGTRVARRHVTQATDATRRGIGNDPEKLDRLLELDGKLLIWHDLSDQLLTPYMSINYYKQLAQRHGGYDRLQRNVRLFTLPGTTHCSGGLGGVGPNSFDALAALENWVEHGRAPNGLVATYYPGSAIGSKDFTQSPGRTMPLCKFPEMARYSGAGNVNDAANWHCPEGDRAMLKVGESGRRAGVME